MSHAICLNIHYTAPPEVWEQIGAVYQSMDYWNGMNAEGLPSWKGDGIDLCTSLEPGGILLEGEMPDAVWDIWYAELKAKLTAQLGYPIGEPEEGYWFKYWEPFRKQYAALKSVDSKIIRFQDGSGFYWDQFDIHERNITAKPPYFAFRSPLIELVISFERTGIFAAKQQKQDFHDFQNKLQALGITTLDLS